MEGADLHVHMAAAHLLDCGFKFATFTVEQRHYGARLQPQHLHMARGVGRQLDAVARGQRQGAVKARHHIRPKA
jgi:hypothetical protein